MCNIHNVFNSFCTIDMNTTNVPISYNELAAPNLTINENNYFIKNNIGKTKFVEELKYNEIQNILYIELKNNGLTQSSK